MVYCIGETVYDILFREDVPVAARPGGSMLNTAVSLGKAGIPVTFISETGTDAVGEKILCYLRKNNVSTGFIRRYPGSQTPVSLAFLDGEGDAHYTFYRSLPGQREIIPLPMPAKEDLVAFGSYYAVAPSIRNSVKKFIHSARAAEALVFYDPNFRPSHRDELPGLKEVLQENIFLSDIVRGSDEDFLTIFDVKEGRKAYERILEYGCRYLVYTMNKKGIEIHTPGGMAALPAQPVTPLSTVGAGDAFNAGMIFHLVRSGVGRDGIGRMGGGGWEAAGRWGIAFATDVCMGYDNTVSEKFIKELAG